MTSQEAVDWHGFYRRLIANPQSVVSAADILTLQQTVGNRTVNRLLANREHQHSLIGQTGADIIQRNGGIDKSTINKVREELKGSSNEHLVKDIGDGLSHNDARDILIENFSERSDFTYVPASLPPFQHRGSCYTLSLEFCQIASKLGIPSQVSQKVGPIYINGAHKIIGKDVNGNVNNGTGWFFPDGHVVANCGGTEVDVLFHGSDLQYAQLERKQYEGIGTKEKPFRPYYWTGGGMAIYKVKPNFVTPSNYFTTDASKKLMTREEFEAYKAL